MEPRPGPGRPSAGGGEVWLGAEPAPGRSGFPYCLPVDLGQVAALLRASPHSEGFRATSWGELSTQASSGSRRPCSRTGLTGPQTNQRRGRQLLELDLRSFPLWRSGEGTVEGRSERPPCGRMAGPEPAIARSTRQPPSSQHVMLAATARHCQDLLGSATISACFSLSPKHMDFNNP